MIYDLVDIILLKHPHLKRETVQEILTTTTDVIVENVKDNKCVKWTGLCTFTWKKKAKTKKEAADWAEFPYKALGDKLRIVADPKADFGDKDVTIKSTIKDLTIGEE